MQAQNPFINQGASTPPVLDTRLAILVKYLPQLREMGVLNIKIDGIEVNLRPAQPQEQAPAAPQPVQGRDPMTMGLAGNLKIPTLRDRHG